MNVPGADLSLYLRQLPNELLFNVLSNIEEENLVQSCYRSAELRAVCDDPFFWQQKFNQEDLPLLEEGQNAGEWISIYRASLLARRQVELAMNRFQPLLQQKKTEILAEISLQDILLPKILATGPISEEQIEAIFRQERFKLEALTLQKDSRSPNANPSLRSILPTSAIKPQEEINFYLSSYQGQILYNISDEIVQSQAFLAGLTTTLNTIINEVISPADLAFLLHKFYYYGQGKLIRPKGIFTRDY